MIISDIFTSGLRRLGDHDRDHDRDHHHHHHHHRRWWDGHRWQDRDWDD
jgi:hypothetical protein